MKITVAIHGCDGCCNGAYGTTGQYPTEPLGEAPNPTVSGPDSKTETDESRVEVARADLEAVSRYLHHLPGRPAHPFITGGPCDCSAGRLRAALLETNKEEA